MIQYSCAQFSLPSFTLGSVTVCCPMDNLDEYCLIAQTVIGGRVYPYTWCESQQQFPRFAIAATPIGKGFLPTLIMTVSVAFGVVVL